ncbi:MAG: bifunctional transcriptional activator/DNA repair protein Ada [Candidatus Riflebacteria bacterium]|nr:bifunctional transcriptional activator/DNA repair protein Ada [Candidatus Riflebacteria bacterium]
MAKLPPIHTMYRALCDRDSSFEGVFYAGVRTTGIFCRPTCPARKPRSDNVEYFPSSRDALHAGYRPCGRCRPLEKNVRPPALLRRLCEMIEESPTRITDLDLERSGVDPSTARRQFLRHYGMTFQAYQRARRMGLALHEVRGGSAVIDSQLDSGFESASGFWQAFKKVFGVPPVRAGLIDCLQARWIDTPLGAMLAVADAAGLHLLEFVDRRGLEREVASLRKRTGWAIVPGNNAHLERIREELDRYFEGVDTTFTVPLVLHGSPFQVRVWELLRTIRPGETWSYARLAREAGRPSAVRAVGHANGHNRLALVVRCHRVIRADGSLCGYGGGIWRKRWLLDHERRVVGRSREPAA